MRTRLKELKDGGIHQLRCTATVGQRHSSIRFGGKVSFQKMLLGIECAEHELKLNHLVMTIGKEIPAIPIVYSRIMPGTNIEFIGEITEYRRRDGSRDYGIRMTKLISAESNHGTTN